MIISGYNEMFLLHVIYPFWLTVCVAHDLFLVSTMTSVTLKILFCDLQPPYEGHK